MTRTIMIMAGGTGGHIFPGIAVAEALRARHWNIVWLGAQTGMEAQLVPPRGYTMAWVAMTGVRGKGWRRLAALPVQLTAALWQSLRALRTHKPDVVLGMGGYVSFPGGVMSALCGVPLAVHEQNAIAGLTNRTLAVLARRVFTGFPGTFNSPKSEWTGNPVRPEVGALPPPAARYGARSGPLQVAVLGGSLGAQALNDVVPRALALMPPETRPRVTHQSGQKHYWQVEANYRAAGVDARLTAFVDDMARCYAEADLIICRAGASTIAELACAGVASVLVPFPHAVDDHQTRNAGFLAERGAAVLVPQHELTPEMLAALLGDLTREKLSQMAQRAREAAKPDAANAVADACARMAA